MGIHIPPVPPPRRRWDGACRRLQRTVRDGTGRRNRRRAIASRRYEYLLCH